MRTTRVFLADDHMLVRQGMRSLLEMEEDLVIVGEASNGHEAIEKVLSGPRPHVILMDVHMPMLTGIDATRRIKMAMPDVLVIGLTAAEDDSTLSDMMRAGANAYVLKSSAASDLVKTIRAVRANRAAVDLELRQRLSHYNAYNDQSAPEAKKNLHQRLTRREMDVMQALLQGYSNKEIARQLVISERTVQTHLSNIFSKMDVNSRTEAVLVAMRDGWISQQPVA